MTVNTGYIYILDVNEAPCMNEDKTDSLSTSED